MAMQQVVVCLPEKLALRLKRQVPARKRSAFMQKLLEQALLPDKMRADLLYQAAMAVEEGDWLAAGIDEWDATVGDGLAPELPKKPGL